MDNVKACASGATFKNYVLQENSDVDYQLNSPLQFGRGPWAGCYLNIEFDTMRICLGYTNSFNPGLASIHPNDCGVLLYDTTRNSQRLVSGEPAGSLFIRNSNNLRILPCLVTVERIKKELHISEPEAIELLYTTRKDLANKWFGGNVDNLMWFARCIVEILFPALTVLTLETCRTFVLSDLYTISVKEHALGMLYTVTASEVSYLRQEDTAWILVNRYDPIMKGSVQWASAKFLVGRNLDALLGESDVVVHFP